MDQMLNEFIELKAYVTEPESSIPRLQPYLLTDYFSEDCNLIGIEHILTLIARSYIFSNNNLKRGEMISMQLVDDTIELLHRWTGFSDTDSRKRTKNDALEVWMNENDITDSWLKRYWIYQFNSKKISRKGIQSAEEFWEKLERKWNRSLNMPLDYLAGRITYRNIVANSLEIGPLRNRYLVLKKDPCATEKVKVNKRFKYLFDESSRQESSDMKIVKLIATYLINIEKHPKGQKEVWVSNSELANWFGKDDAKHGNITWYPKNALWNGTPIYKRIVVKGGGTKLYFDEKYLKEFDFHIICCNEVKDYGDDYWILEDKGHVLEDCWVIK